MCLIKAKRHFNCRIERRYNTNNLKSQFVYIRLHCKTQLSFIYYQVQLWIIFVDCAEFMNHEIYTQLNYKPTSKTYALYAHIIIGQEVFFIFSNFGFRKHVLTQPFSCTSWLTAIFLRYHSYCHNSTLKDSYRHICTLPDSYHHICSTHDSIRLCNFITTGVHSIFFSFLNLWCGLNL